MLGRKCPRGEPGAVAVVGPGNSTTNQQLHSTTVSESCQPPRDLPSLAREAEGRAEACRLLWQACELIGDDRGAAYWRRRQLAHQSIIWACRHLDVEGRP